MLEPGPLDQAGPAVAAAVAAVLPEDLVASVEAPAGAPGVGEQSGGLRGEVPVLWMGWKHQG